MKIYTKRGDLGETSLFGGKRVTKGSPRIAAYGTVDELNSALGIVLSLNPVNEVSKKLARIQMELMVLGSDLSAPLDLKIKTLRINRSFTTRLEKEIDVMGKKLPELKNFILPGGSPVGTHLHLARTIARRAERSVVELAAIEKINPNAISYVNRLADWLFTLARYTNMVEGQKEFVWRDRGK